MKLFDCCIILALERQRTIGFTGKTDSINPPKWLSNENPEWSGNYLVKYGYSGWKQIVFTYLDKIIEQDLKEYT